MDTMGYLRKIGQFGKNPDGSYTRHIFSLNGSVRQTLSGAR